MNQNVFKKKNIALLAMSAVLTFGSFALMGDNSVLATQQQVKSSVSPVEIQIDDGATDEMKVMLDEELSELNEKERERIEKELLEKSNEQQATDQTETEDKPAPQFIKDLEPNHEFTIGGYTWNLLNPQDGFIIMLDSVEELDLDFEYKEGDYNGILEYFDNEFMATLSADEKALLVNDQFGLTFFNSKLYVTANLNPDAKPFEAKEVDKNEKETNKEKTKEKEGSMTWLYILIVLILIVAVGIFVKYLQDKNTDKENSEKDKK